VRFSFWQAFLSSLGHRPSGFKDQAGAARPQSFCSRCCASILCPRRRISSSRKLGRFSFSLCSLSVYGTRRERANVSGKALGILRGVSLKPGVFSLFPGVLAVSSCYSYSSFIKELHLFFFLFFSLGKGDKLIWML